MCEPVTATTALSAIGGGSASAGGVALASSGLSLLGSKSAIDNQNSAAAANRANAIQSMNNQIDDQGRQYVEQNRSLIQGAFDSVLAGREAEADSYTSAIANGVQGASVKAMMADKGQTTTRSAKRTLQEAESLRTQTGANFKNIRAGAQGQINRVSTTSFGIGDAAKALTPIIRTQME